MYNKFKIVLIIGLALASVMSEGSSLANDKFPLSSLPKDAVAVVLSHLPRVEVGQDATVCKQWAAAARRAHTIKDAQLLNNPYVQQFLGEFIELPAVTQEEVNQLQAALTERNPNEQTHIVPMPKFNVAKATVSIGLYHAIMERYPDLEKADWPTDPQERAALQQGWINNPDLPLTNTTLDEDQEFVQRLNRLTGRHFRVMSESQDEYARRGRTHGKEGAITSSVYHFGDSENEVRNRAFISTNPLTQDRSHGVHEILAQGADGAKGQEANYSAPEKDFGARTFSDYSSQVRVLAIEAAATTAAARSTRLASPKTLPGELYTNSFGLVHPIGNVYSRSSGGVVRGGAFSYNEWNAKSSYRHEGYAEDRYDIIGLRLAEDLP